MFANMKRAFSSWLSVLNGIFQQIKPTVWSNEYKFRWRGTLLNGKLFLIIIRYLLAFCEMACVLCYKCDPRHQYLSKQEDC